MAEPQLTPFEHILIGLVCLSPASGYDLKRIFAATPMGVYQPSSGSLYPALQKVLLKGWAKAASMVSDSGRRVREYRITASGKKQLESEVAEYRRVSNAIGSVLDTA